MTRLLLASLLFAAGQLVIFHDCTCSPCTGRPPAPLRVPDDGCWGGEEAPRPADETCPCTHITPTDSVAGPEPATTEMSSVAAPAVDEKSRARVDGEDVAVVDTGPPPLASPLSFPLRR